MLWFKGAAHFPHLQWVSSLSCPFPLDHIAANVNTIWVDLSYIWPLCLRTIYYMIIEKKCIRVSRNRHFSRCYCARGTCKSVWTTPMFLVVRRWKNIYFVLGTLLLQNGHFRDSVEESASVNHFRSYGCFSLFWGKEFLSCEYRKKCKFWDTLKGFFNIYNRASGFVGLEDQFLSYTLIKFWRKIYFGLK